MLITIKVQDRTVRIMYSEGDENGYESEPKNMTMGMITKVENEDETSRGG